MSGAQCGTYMIHPKQMNVDYPTNVDDNSITPDGNYAKPLCIPTEMTYFIFRIRFSSIFREMVDAAWDAGSDMDELPYELVLDFDKRLNDLVVDFDKQYHIIVNKPLGKSGDDTEALLGGKRAIIARQRNMALFGLHTRFARLHRPYLVRGAQDPRYAYSRMVCLRSARTVIELGKQMTAASKDLASIKIWSVNHHVFVSTVILVMDYCFNREEPRAKERREEILECFRVLEGSKDESTIATRGLQKLRNMLGDGASGGRAATNHEPTRAAAAPVDAPLPNPNSNPNTNQNPNLQYTHGAFDPVTYQPSDQGFHMAYPNAPLSGSFGQPMLQNQWPDLDYASFENINFDVDLDASQFEALFYNIDTNSELF